MITHLVPKKWRGYEAGGEEFVHLFEEAFPGIPHPKFRMGIIQSAIHEASITQKPILIYIHNIKQAKELAPFLQNTICNPEAIELIVNI